MRSGVGIALCALVILAAACAAQAAPESDVGKPSDAPKPDTSTSDAWKWCINEDRDSLDLQISGCTTVIQSGRESSRAMAIAFNNRGNAYHDEKDYDRAIADYDQAIKLKPDYAHAFGNRGLAYAHKGDPDSAVRDYDEAIRLDPDNASGYNNRGNAYFDKGDYPRAVAD